MTSVSVPTRNAGVVMADLELLGAIDEPAMGIERYSDLAVLTRDRTNRGLQLSKLTPTNPGFGELLLALLDVGPLVAEADGAVEDRRVVEVGGEVAETFELHHVARGDLAEDRLGLRRRGLAGVRVE